jgi:hypothetical protein
MHYLLCTRLTDRVRFAIVIVPVYDDPADEASSPFAKHPAQGDRDWVWFSTMNRVQTQVLKVSARRARRQLPTRDADAAGLYHFTDPCTSTYYHPGLVSDADRCAKEP